MIVRASRRKRLKLSSDIGGGGEATIHQVAGEPDLLAKIYKPEPRPGYEQKLAWMRANPPDDPTRTMGHTSIAWPLDLLYNGNGQFVGYLMHYIRNAVALLEVFNPRLRAQTLPGFDWRYLHRTARNMAVALSALHARGYVIGDLNESNIMVTPSAMVTLIDTDSFQVQAKKQGGWVVFHCPVRKLEYTPPELQGKPLQNVRQYPEHDCFGLGVLIFQLLMNGSHPFRAQWIGSGEPLPVEEKIRLGAFPYMRSPPLPVAPPRNAPALDTLHPRLVDLVQRCFVHGHNKPRQRPTPEDWERAITKAEAGLVKCNQGHYYSNHLRDCPQCVPPPTQTPVAHPASFVASRQRPHVGQVTARAWARARSWATSGVVHGALAGALVWGGGGAVLGAIGGAVGGAIGQVLVWALVWAVMWASGWWAFGEVLGESMRGQSFGKRLGITAAIVGGGVGGGLGWRVGETGVEGIGHWMPVKLVVGAVTRATGGQEIVGVVGRVLTGMVGGVFVWAVIWSVAGMVSGAIAWRAVDVRALAKSFERLPRTLSGVMWSITGAVEGASAGAIVGVVVGAITGAIVGGMDVVVDQPFARASVGAIIGAIVGASGGAIGREHMAELGQKLGRAFEIVEAIVGLTVGLMVARESFALWALSERGVTGVVEGVLVGSVGGALVGLVGGALAGALGGAVVKATEV